MSQIYKIYKSLFIGLMFALMGRKADARARLWGAKLFTALYLTPNRWPDGSDWE
jgi:hypothetical protein